MGNSLKCLDSLSVSKNFENHKNMSKIGKKILKGLEEALAHAQGKLDLSCTIIDVPTPPKNCHADDIKKARKGHNYSQSMFARVLNVSVKTVKSWESGLRTPSGSANRLIESNR